MLSTTGCGCYGDPFLYIEENGPNQFIYNLIYESIKDLTAIVLKEKTLDDVGITETKKKKLVEDMGEFLVALRHIDEESEIEFIARIVGFDNIYWVVKYNRNTRNVFLKRFENTMATNVHLHYDPEHNKEYVSRYEYDLLKYEMQKGEEYNVFLLLAMQDRGWFKGKRELEKWEYYFNRCEVKE